MAFGWRKKIFFDKLLDIIHCLSYSVLCTVYEAQHDPLGKPF